MGRETRSQQAQTQIGSLPGQGTLPSRLSPNPIPRFPASFKISHRNDLRVSPKVLIPSCPLPELMHMGSTGRASGLVEASPSLLFYA